MSKDVLNFSVKGDLITEIARDKFLETGSIIEGVKFLTKALIDFPDDLAEEVIRGRKKLVGVNELTIEDDDKIIEPYQWIKPTDIRHCECGWIAPNGDVYGCPKYTQTVEHHDLASEIIFRGNVPDTESSDERSVEVAGYIKFQPHLICGRCKPALITEAQREKVIEFMESHNIESIQIGFTFDTYKNIKEIRKWELMQFGSYIAN